MIYVVGGFVLVLFPMIDEIRKFGLNGFTFERWLFSLTLRQHIIAATAIRFGFVLLTFGFFQIFVTRHWVKFLEP